MADETKSFWLAALQTVGFPIVAAVAISWGMYDSIRWEREQMLPAIQASAEAIRGTSDALSKNTQAMRDNTEMMHSVKSTLDHINQKKGPQ